MFTNIDINQIKKLTQKEFDQFYELEGWSSTLINSRWVLELMTRDDAPALMISDLVKMLTYGYERILCGHIQPQPEVLLHMR